VFQQTADDVWDVIRDFSNYPVFVDGAAESCIEDGKSHDAVWQILAALSDVGRAQTYTSCGEAPMPVQDFRATLRVVPITDGSRAFIEWSAKFDCAAERRDEWANFFRDGFGPWLGSLRRHVDARSHGAAAQ
jgi:hypothetical protein